MPEFARLAHRFVRLNRTSQQLHYRGQRIDNSPLSILMFQFAAPQLQQLCRLQALIPHHAL